MPKTATPPRKRAKRQHHQRVNRSHRSVEERRAALLDTLERLRIRERDDKIRAAITVDEAVRQLEQQLVDTKWEKQKALLKLDKQKGHLSSLRAKAKAAIKAIRSCRETEALSIRQIQEIRANIEKRTEAVASHVGAAFDRENPPIQ
jgi:hypothetical protein